VGQVGCDGTANTGPYDVRKMQVTILWKKKISIGFSRKGCQCHFFFFFFFTSSLALFIIVRTQLHKYEYKHCASLH